jgi:uncharacterized protein YyaL (SSP411 family)
LLLGVHTRNTTGDDGDMNAPSDKAAEANAGPPSAQHVNRLAGETSPYLLQHAHNPVDWYPWGDEALERARRENKPIFLSIGYSSCHWCHVMERESFEDDQTAEILNAHFVSIKVDREERPDLDEIYMTAVQLMTGGGGWPLSVFLTPDLEPFYGGTYFPPEDRLGMPSFRSVLRAVAAAWGEKPDKVAELAGQMVEAIQANAAPALSGSGLPDASVLSNAAAELKAEFDPRWGGFGHAPKFPPGSAIALLLRQQLHAGDEGLLEMSTVTLDRMACGGMYDQIGGGFHRYSVDTQWLVPHFEKMLYDNAILTQVYLEAYQATGRDLYRRVARGILEYVLREMTDPCGGFHSAEDADSEGEEGKFYVWRPHEISAVLGEEDGAFFSEYYGVTERGNFEGGSILHIPHDPANFAAAKGISEGQLEDRLAPLRRKLLAERSKRVRPGKDDKVLAAWNGMMISAFARAYQILGDERYLHAAERAADFVLREMVRDGGLLRTYRATDSAGEEGLSKLPAYLDDYAQMAGALVDLYEASFELRWLEAADDLARKMVADFWDEKDGAFFYTSAAHGDLLVRTKPFFDGAVPSGNSAATAVLLRLSKLLDNEDYRQKAESVLASMADRMREQPRAHLDLLVAADFSLRPSREIALAGQRDSDQTRRLLGIIHRRFIPNKILAIAEPGDAGAKAAETIPLLRGKSMIADETTVYVCEGFACKRPVRDDAGLEAMLED